MCGIATIVMTDGRPMDVELLTAMTEAMAHRGPDARAVAEVRFAGSKAPTIGMGHCRLAVIDLADRARQPMTRGGVTVTYNGEIYNYLELRAELVAQGYEFSTTSDTEVLLQAYRAWGESFLDRLNGIFALVLWDEPSTRLLAARDRLGVKPLFWTVLPGGLAFASEVGPLVTARNGAEVEEAVVYDFLLNGRLDHSEETFYAGIQRLPAGSILTADGGAEPRIRHYWSIQPSDERAGRSFADNVEEFGALFHDAVALQMRADVPVACCLSGGLDSTAVAAVASKLTDTPMTVFTARYRHPEMDEWRYAQALHAEREVEPVSVFAEPVEFWAHLDEVVSAQGEPFAGPGVFAQWRLMREISARGIKVVLDGQGGDELLCGYAKYFYFHLADLVRSGRLVKAAGAALSALTAGGPQLFNLAGARRYLPGGMWLDRRKETLLQPDFQARWADRQVHHPTGSVPQQQIVDLTRFGLPTLLRYEDRNSMAHGVESRVPFLDHRLVEFALSIPVEHKLRGARSKVILREALKSTLPEKVRRRRSKLGFGGSWHLWVRDLEAELRSWLARPHLEVDRFTQRAALHVMLRRHDPAIFHSLVLDRWLGAR